MPNKKNTDDTNDNNGGYKVSLRDVVIVMAAVISVVGAWGVYGTRISVIETRLISISDDISDIKQITKDVTENKKDMDKRILALEFETIRNNRDR